MYTSFYILHSVPLTNVCFCVRNTKLCKYFTVSATVDPEIL